MHNFFRRPLVCFGLLSVYRRQYFATLWLLLEWPAPSPQPAPSAALVTCCAAVLVIYPTLSLGRHRILEGLCPDKGMLEASTQELLEEREEAYEVLRGSGLGPAGC